MCAMKGERPDDLTTQPTEDSSTRNDARQSGRITSSSLRRPLSEFGTRLRAARRDRLYLNSAALVLNTGINAAFGLVFWTVAARHFAAGDIGIVTATTSLAGVLGTIGCLGLPNALIRYMSRAGRSVRKLLLLSLVITQTLTLIVSSAVALTALAPPAVHALPGGFIAVLLFMQTTAASMILDASMMAMRHAEYIALKNAFVGVVRLVVLFAVLAPDTPVESLLWIQTGTAAAGSGAAVVFLLTRLIPSMASQAAPRLGGLARYSGSNLLAMTVGILPASVTPSIVLHYGDAAAAAYFSFCIMLIGLLNIFASSISQSMFAEASYGRHPNQLLRQATRSLVVVLLPAVGVAILAAPLGLWLFGAEYKDQATLALRVMVLGCIPSGISYLIDASVNGRGDGRGYFLLNLQNSILVLVFVALGAHSHGINGAAVGWAAAQLVSVGISICYLRWFTVKVSPVGGGAVKPAPESAESGDGPPTDPVEQPARKQQANTTSN
ncbi:MAG: lipopolysaccharide biosynthesis protein [Microlunatus sp.]